MFACKICKEKDARIADLKEQLTKSQQLITTLTVVPQYGAALTRELNLALDGGGQSEAISNDQISERDAIEDEARNMLNGTY